MRWVIRRHCKASKGHTYSGRDARALFDSHRNTVALFRVRTRSVRLYQLLLSARRHWIVVAELHEISALAPGQRLQSRLIISNLGKRNERRERRESARQRVVPVDTRALRRQVPSDIADRAGGRRDLQP